MQKINKFDNVHFKNILLNLESIEDSTGKLNGVKMAFNSTHEDKIHHKSNGQVVGFFPENLTVSLDLRSLIQLNSLFLQTISSYLYNIRSKIFQKDLVEVIHSKIDEKRYIRVRVSKYFFREEEKGRYKISIAIINKGIDNNDDIEIVNINFSKRDIVIFSSLLRTMISSYLRSASLTTLINFVDKETNEIVDTKLGGIAKIDNALLIEGVWLHGQELMNIMYTVDQLIYKLHIEKNLNNLNSFYRQTKFIREDDILYLHVSKMDGEHNEVPLIIDGRECFMKIPMSSDLLSALFLYLDINVLRHADFEYDMKNMDILGSQKVDLGDKVKFHISMRESFLGIAIRPKVKNPEESRITLVGKTKDGQFQEENDVSDILENFIKKYNKAGEKVLVPVLTEFQIDLKDQWPKLIAALGIAYTREYITEEKTWNLMKFFVINQNNKGKFKYEFTIFADEKNKAPAVLIIDQYQIKKGEDDKLLARYRQPLFEKYIYQLISIILTASEDIQQIDLTQDMNLKSLLQYKYKSFESIQKIKKDKQIDFGIKKTVNDVEIGNYTQELTSLLNLQDIALLNISSFFRLTKGYWIPFVGDKISVGQDGFLTDMYGELNMEEDKKGSIWATKIFFGTSI